MRNRIPLLYDDIADVTPRACDDGAVIEITRTCSSEDGYTLILDPDQTRALITALEPYAAPKPALKDFLLVTPSPTNKEHLLVACEPFNLLINRLTGEVRRDTGGVLVPIDRRSGQDRRSSDCPPGGSTPQTECAQWAHAAGVWEHNANQYKKEAEEAKKKIAVALSHLTGRLLEIPKVNSAVNALREGGEDA